MTAFQHSSLKTDAALRKALASKVTDSTVIIVAQRISDNTSRGPDFSYG